MHRPVIRGLATVMARKSAALKLLLGCGRRRRASHCAVRRAARGRRTTSPRYPGGRRAARVCDVPIRSSSHLAWSRPAWKGTGDDRGGPARSPRTPVGVGFLVGREEVLTALQRALEPGDETAGRIVIAGPPGIGKPVCSTSCVRMPRADAGPWPRNCLPSAVAQAVVELVVDLAREMLQLRARPGGKLQAALTLNASRGDTAPEEPDLEQDQRWVEVFRVARRRGSNHRQSHSSSSSTMRRGCRRRASWSVLEPLLRGLERRHGVGITLWIVAEAGSSLAQARGR